VHLREKDRLLYKIHCPTAKTAIVSTDLFSYTNQRYIYMYVN